jgi:hypothetical protein
VLNPIENRYKYVRYDASAALETIGAEAKEKKGLT